MAVDFTSALFLGLNHPSETLSWSTLTTGIPAALRRSADAIGAARDFAALVGCGKAVATSSTLHALSDLFGALWQPPTLILCDEAVYPIARWAMERAERRGARVVPFRHLDPADLTRRLRQAMTSGASIPGGAALGPSARRSRSRSPFAAPVWLVTDGFCAGCARAAPLEAFARLLRRWDGLLIVDDAQAVGLFGRGASQAAPFGHGGGGSLVRAHLPPGSKVLLVASMSKALGAPLAMVAGTAALLDAFDAGSETLVHCSPPSTPVLAAARRALACSRSAVGDRLRSHLADRIRFLRRALAARGFVVRGGLFPMQRLPMPDTDTALAWQQRLAERGVRAVVRRARCNDESSLTFIVTARHTAAQLRRAADALAVVARERRGLDGAGRAPDRATWIGSAPLSFNLEV